MRAIAPQKIKWLTRGFWRGATRYEITLELTARLTLTCTWNNWPLSKWYVSLDIIVHLKASSTSLIWALLPSNQSVGEGRELRRKRLGKEIGLETRMEHTVRQADSRFRVGA